MQPITNNKQSITIKPVVATQVQHERVCEVLGCWRVAVAFDSCLLMFVCQDHKRVEVQG